MTGWYSHRSLVMPKCTNLIICSSTFAAKENLRLALFKSKFEITINWTVHVICSKSVQRYSLKEAVQSWRTILSWASLLNTDLQNWHWMDCIVWWAVLKKLKWTIPFQVKIHKKNCERDLDEGQALNVDVTEQSRIIETLFKVARLR